MAPFPGMMPFPGPAAPQNVVSQTQESTLPPKPSTASSLAPASANSLPPKAMMNSLPVSPKHSKVLHSLQENDIKAPAPPLKSLEEIKEYPDLSIAIPSTITTNGSGEPFISKPYPLVSATHSMTATSPTSASIAPTTNATSSHRAISTSASTTVLSGRKDIGGGGVLVYFDEELCMEEKRSSVKRYQYSGPTPVYH